MRTSPYYRRALRAASAAALAPGLALALLSACGLVTEPGGALVVATDRARHARASPDSAARVGFTMRNAGFRALYVGRCGPSTSLYVERFSAGLWRVAESATICPAIYSTVPLELHPGAQHGPQVLVLRSGRYRLRVPFGATAAEPYAAAAVSKAFVVE